MIHNYIDDTQHYAVGNNGAGAVLLQVQDAHGVQARIALTPEEANQASIMLRQQAGIVYAGSFRPPRMLEEYADWANAGAAYSDAEGGL